MNKRLMIARWISILGHPFSFVVLLVGLTGFLRHGFGGTMRLVGITVIVVVIPLWIFMWRKWKSGSWKTVDASDRGDRPSFYGVALLLIGLLTGCFVFVEGSSSMLRGGAAVAVMMGVAAVLNRWIKLSNHVAFATFTGVLLSRFALPWSVGVLCLVPLIVWSRLTLARHRWSEVLGGAILGAVIGAVTAWA